MRYFSQVSGTVAFANELLLCLKLCSCMFGVVRVIKSGNVAIREPIKLKHEELQ